MKMIIKISSIKKIKEEFNLEFIALSFIIVFSLMNIFGNSSSVVNYNASIISAIAQTDEGEKESNTTKNKESKENNNNNNNDLTTIIVQMDKYNMINSENNNNTGNLLKITGYLNGEGQTKYVDLKEIDKEIINQNEKFFKVDLKFNKSSDISSTMVDDEYYVCAYVIEDRIADDDIINTIPLYDCDEGNIGTSTTKDTVTLFSTMKKYGESKAFYTTNQNTATDISNPTNEVKITINVPVYDAKDIDDMNVVAMVKGEYQIKTVDVQNELENRKNKNEPILVPFTFDRQTEVGPIQPGDLFFGCATSDEFPNQNSDCEKKMIKDLDKISKICARKDNSC